MAQSPKSAPKPAPKPNRTSSRGVVLAVLAVALVVLAVSFLPDLAAWAGDEWPGTNGKSIGTLIVMHIAVGAVCYYVLPAFGRRRSE